jgi:hypothetical protein
MMGGVAVMVMRAVQDGNHEGSAYSKHVNGGKGEEAFCLFPPDSYLVTAAIFSTASHGRPGRPKCP